MNILYIHISVYKICVFILNYNYICVCGYNTNYSFVTMTLTWLV